MYRIVKKQDKKIIEVLYEQDDDKLLDRLVSVIGDIATNIKNASETLSYYEYCIK
jgi:hypothetical protein